MASPALWRRGTLRIVECAKNGVYSHGSFYSKVDDPGLSPARRSRPQVLVCKVVIMRSLPCLVMAFTLVVNLFGLSPLAGPAALRAEDLEQRLKAAFNAEKSDADPDAKDEEKPAAKEESKEESNGAKKDEGSGKADQAKPAAPAAAATPKPKYPPYEEVVKDATK